MTCDNETVTQILIAVYMDELARSVSKLNALGLPESNIRKLFELVMKEKS